MFKRITFALLTATTLFAAACNDEPPPNTSVRTDPRVIAACEEVCLNKVAADGCPDAAYLAEHAQACADACPNQVKFVPAGCADIALEAYECQMGAEWACPSSSPSNPVRVPSLVDGACVEETRAYGACIAGR